MTLSNWAKKYGISYSTAWRLWKQGNLKGFKLPTGTIIVLDDDKEHGLRKGEDGKTLD